MMNKYSYIAGFAVLLFAAWRASDAQAGLMVIDDMQCSPAEGMAATPAGEKQPDESRGDTSSKLLATQPAQGGATGSTTLLTIGSALVAVLTTTLPQTTLEPVGFCLELENSQLPSPPASDLLRPPRHNG